MNAQAPCPKSYMDQLRRGLTPHKFQWEQCQFVAFKQELSVAQAVHSASSEDTRYLFSLGKTCTHFLVIQSLIVRSSICTGTGHLQLSSHPHGAHLDRGYLRGSHAPI